MEILTDIASKIGFDWKLSLTHLINFLIIFFLLVRFALPSIKKTIAERTKKIEEGLRMRNEADKIVEEAKTKGQEIIHTANKKGEEFYAKVEASSKKTIAEANHKASEIIQTAEREKSNAKVAGLKEAESILAKDMPKILTKVASNAFSAKITPEVNADFLKSVFKM